MLSQSCELRWETTEKVQGREIPGVYTIKGQAMPIMTVKTTFPPTSYFLPIPLRAAIQNVSDASLQPSAKSG